MLDGFNANATPTWQSVESKSWPRLLIVRSPTNKLGRAKEFVERFLLGIVFVNNVNFSWKSSKVLGLVPNRPNPLSARKSIPSNETGFCVLKESNETIVLVAKLS